MSFWEQRDMATEYTAADKVLGNEVAAKTETPYEAAIDAANGLRGQGGRRPTPEDFADVLSPEGNSGHTVGSDITDHLLDLSDDGSLGATPP